MWDFYGRRELSPEPKELVQDVTIYTGNRPRLLSSQKSIVVCPDPSTVSGDVKEIKGPASDS